MSDPAPVPAALGPLGPLAGEWEGHQGIDDSYVYAARRDMSSRFRELTTFKPAGRRTTAREAGRVSYDQQTFMYQPHPGRSVLPPRPQHTRAQMTSGGAGRY